MTHDERISSYIDNELSSQDEQDFLISLAASDGLRKSFRSELVLKNILHRDESSTNPPRKLRTAVFATLGISAATSISAEKAEAGVASQAASSAWRAPRGLLKALFATKLNVLATAGALAISALAGYGVRTVTAPAPQAVELQAVEQPSHVTTPAPVQQFQSPAVNPEPVNGTMNRASGTSPLQNHYHSTASRHGKLATIMHKHIQHAESAKAPVNGTVGAGTMKIDPPKINQH